MNALKKSLKWTHGRLGIRGTLLLMAPALWCIWTMREFAAWSLLSALRGHLPRDVMYRTLFIFTFMTALSVPYVAGLRWLSDRKNRIVHWTYFGLVLILGLVLLSLLIWPTHILVEYISTMGITPRRMAGLVYAISGGLFVSAFYWWAIRAPEGTAKPWSAARIAASCCTAVCRVVVGALSRWSAGEADRARTRRIAAWIIHPCSLLVMIMCAMGAGEFGGGLNAAWDAVLRLLHIRPL
jgi:hypothetical protein